MKRKSENGSDGETLTKNGNPRIAGSQRTKREWARDMAEYRVLHLSGLQPEALRKAMGWEDENGKVVPLPQRDYEELSTRVQNEDEHRVKSLTRESVFADYSSRQLIVARELRALYDRMVEDVDEEVKYSDDGEEVSRFKHIRNATAQVAALRALSEIHDRIVRVGLETGVIARAPRELSVDASIDIGIHMTRGKLLEEVQAEAQRTAEIFRAAGETGRAKEIEQEFRTVLTLPAPSAKQSRSRRIKNIVQCGGTAKGSGIKSESEAN